MYTYLSSILYQSSNGLLVFFCPGCELLHEVNLAPMLHQKDHWSWNGDPNKPTFHPSYNLRTGHYCSGQPQPPNCWLCNRAEEQDKDSLCRVCHSWIRDGEIEFLNDCTHSLSGRRVPLQVIPSFVSVKKTRT